MPRGNPSPMPHQTRFCLLLSIVCVGSTLHCSATSPSDPSSAGAPAGGTGSGSAGGAGAGGTTDSGATGGAGSGGTTASSGGATALAWHCTDQPNFAPGHTCSCTKNCNGNCGLTACPSLACCASFADTISPTPTPTPGCTCIAADHIALSAQTCDAWATGNHCSLAKPCSGTRVTKCPG